MTSPRFATLAVLCLLGVLSPDLARAQDDDGPNIAPPGAEPAPPETPREIGQPPESTPPPLAPARGGVNINFVDQDLMSLLQYFARATGRNFIIGDPRDLQGKKVTIISNKPVGPDAAYEAFLSALEIHSLTTVKVGALYKIIKADVAQQSPGPIQQGGTIAATDNYVTQIIQLENVSVSDVRQIIDTLVSPNAKVLAYAPTNSLILTDSGNNVRRINQLLQELDVAAPKSTLVIYAIAYADAEEIKGLIEELYGTGEDAEEVPDASRSRRSRLRRRTDEPEQGEGVTAGKESKYISKVLSDERTNSLIVLANEQGHEAVRDLISKIDIDVDPTSRSQIYVYRLEHAKAEDVASVLQDLSQGTNSSSSQQQRDPAAARLAARQRGAAEAEAAQEKTGAVAAFDEGLRIAADETTNSLVIIASKDDYAVISSVIEQLDVRRKQVFVEAVIMELSSSDGVDWNLAYHAPLDLGGGAAGLLGSQLGATSLGLNPASALGKFTGGVFGKSVDVPTVDTTTGETTSLSIPAFGIVLEALKTSQMTNIVSVPGVLAFDNEEAKIIIGRKVPFPTQSFAGAGLGVGGVGGLATPLVSFQREDVAITLEVTPRINSENVVTMELRVEVSEIEDSAGSGANILQQGGFITSKREVETTALVGDNQTVVIGGLMSSFDNESESKIPILGDLPVIGALFRQRSTTTRRTNLVVFITPHIVDDDGDFEEIMRVKEAQRQEFMRRFYGKSQDEQAREIMRLLQFSMNVVGRPSMFRGPTAVTSSLELDGQPVSAASREELREASERRAPDPGSAAGSLPRAGTVTIDRGTPDAAETPADGADTAPEATPDADGGGASPDAGLPADDGSGDSGGSDDAGEPGDDGQTGDTPGSEEG